MNLDQLPHNAACQAIAQLPPDQADCIAQAVLSAVRGWLANRTELSEDAGGFLVDLAIRLQQEGLGPVLLPYAAPDRIQDIPKGVRMSILSFVARCPGALTADQWLGIYRTDPVGLGPFVLGTLLPTDPAAGLRVLRSLPDHPDTLRLAALTLHVHLRRIAAGEADALIRLIEGCDLPKHVAALMPLTRQP